MGEMVINYTIGRKSAAEFESELKPALGELTRERALLLELMAEDQRAYEVFSALRKLPADSSERIDKLPVALLACIRAPQTMGATALAILELCDRVINFVNFHLLSDLAVCADLAMATLRCSVYNVRVNLNELTDPEDRRRIESTTSQLLTRAAEIIREVSPRIWARHEQGV
jgi:formiminotetrahydrofolate cyclodeaminase